MNTQQYERMASGKGFVAALDQSGGSKFIAVAYTACFFPVYAVASGVQARVFNGLHQLFHFVGHHFGRRSKFTQASTAESIHAVKLSN